MKTKFKCDICEEGKCEGEIVPCFFQSKKMPSLVNGYFYYCTRAIRIVESEDCEVTILEEMPFKHES